MDFDADNQNLIGIFTTDENFVVLVWDAALEQMTGISADAARGKSIAEIIPDLESRGLLPRFRRVLEQGTVEILAPAFHRFLISCPPRFGKGRFRKMRQRVTIAPLGKIEAIRGLIVTIEDVTLRMERESELAEQLKNADDSVRLQAAKSIAHEAENLGEETAAPIIDALGDRNWRVRRELVESLTRRAAPEAIAALLRAVQEKHFDFSVLNSALQVLQATSVETTETLIEFLRGADADLRMQAALTLGEQKNARAIPALLEALADENANVRFHVIEALGKLRAKESVEPLLAIAETRDFFLAFVALEALSRIPDESITERLLPLLNDEVLGDAAAQTLGAVGGAAAAAALVELLNENAASARAAAGALESLFERFEETAAESRDLEESARSSITDKGKANLLAAIDRANEAEAPALIRLAGRLDDEKLRAKLARLIEDDENLREEAAAALGRHGAAALALLGDCLATGETDVCRTAARTLGKIGDARAVEPLIELLEKSRDAATRRIAVESLKAVASAETLPRVAALFSAPEAHLREAAVRIVGALGGAAYVDRIFEFCTDDDERLRRAAIEQLPTIADDRSLPALIRALKEESPRVREAAAKALAGIGGDRAASALREALDDEDSWTRYFAVRALGTLGDAAESREKLSEMAERDAAEQVRAAAREVLDGQDD